MTRMRPSHEKNKHFIEWALFMLVAVISFNGAWIFNGHNTHAFLRDAYDGLGYYQWLPGNLVEHRIDWMYWCYKIAPDRAISLFTLGVACLELPFFLVSQWITWLFDYPNDGFSPPNAIAMMLSASVYAGAGAVLAFKLARRFSTEASALLAVLVLFASTNLFYYCTREPLMSHVYSFFLIALFCWCGLRVIDGPRPVHVFAFILSGSLVVLVRQVNVFTFIFPLWMAVSSPGGLRGMFKNLGGHRLALGLGILAALVPWLLQMMYWYHLTGSIWVNGYALKGEHFEWDKMVPGLLVFGPRNGWLVYSPVLIVPMILLFVYAWRNTPPARPILLIVMLTVLIYSAWWCWWMGGSYGHRAMVDLYALLAIPLAWFFRSVFRRSWATRIAIALFLIVCIRLNIELMEPWRWYWGDAGWTWPKLMEQVGAIGGGWNP